MYYQKRRYKPRLFTTNSKQTTMIYYSTSTKLVSENYPYGNLRTTKTDWIEFKKGKGFRHMSQTINPKTGRLNNPKASTYYYIMLLGRDENGHVKSWTSWAGGGIKEINDDAKFMHENFTLFTPEQIEEVTKTIFLKLKASTIASVQYCGAKFEDLKPFFEVAVKAAVDIIKTKENLFDFINVNEEGVNACKVPDFQPFKIVSSGPIALSTLAQK